MKLVVKSKQLITDAAKPPVPQGIVVVDGDKVVQAGAPDVVQLPPESKVVDCTSDTVLPGLIDAHSHISVNTKYRLSLMEQFQLDLPTAVLRGSMNLRSDLASGVTTMRAVGDRADLELRFRDAIDRGEIPGPRLIISIRALRPRHGTAQFLATPADGLSELRQQIREIFCLGADVLKLFVTNVQNGMTLEDYLRGDLTQVPAYTREEIAHAIDLAHDLGMKVAGHAIGGPGLRWAAECGIDSVEHANLIERQDIDLLLKHGTFLSDPNLQLFFDDETGFETFDTWRFDWWRQKVRAAREHTRTLLPEAVRSGVKICLGTDSTHGTLWREARHFVALGMSPQKALMAVTKNPAELLGMADQVGTLEPGKVADIIAVAGDPLADITALRHIKLVMKAGQLYEAL